MAELHNFCTPDTTTVQSVIAVAAALPAERTSYCTSCDPVAVAAGQQLP